MRVGPYKCTDFYTVSCLTDTLFFYTESSLAETLILHCSLTETLFLHGFALIFEDTLIFFQKLYFYTMFLISFYTVF